MKAIILASAMTLIAASSAAAEQPCVTGERRGGLDFSLPCYRHSPIPAEDSVVRFSPGSADLSPEARAILDRQAAVLRLFPNDPVGLVGHADTAEAKTGSEMAALGERRAKAVREYLIGQGVAPGRITASGRDAPFMIPRETNAESLARMRVVFTLAGDH